MLASVLAGMMLMATDPAAPSPPPIQSALLSIGYEQARLSDFEGTPQYASRLADPAGFLSVSADFRGDGGMDQAAILRNVERDVAYVVVNTTRKKIDTYIVKIVPLSQAADLGLRAAPPVAGKAWGLTVFSLTSAASETFDLAGENFAPRPAP